MTHATLSILGLYQYDETLFDGMIVPTDANKENAVNTIVFNNAELEILYPDFDFLKRAITLWSRSRIHEWNRIWLALHEEYNPLHNFDRHEEYSDTGNVERTTSGSSDGDTTGNASQTTANPAYNATAVTDREVVTNSNTSHAETSNESTENTDTSTTHSGHLYGNIGVTKSQEMARDEIELRATDFYTILADEFTLRFCIGVY